jgi:hypothetical protein
MREDRFSESLPLFHLSRNRLRALATLLLSRLRRKPLQYPLPQLKKTAHLNIISTTLSVLRAIAMTPFCLSGSKQFSMPNRT